MTKLKIYTLLFIIIFIQGCEVLFSTKDDNLDIYTSQNLKLGPIGVLTFFKEGYVSPNNINKLAADWLTEELFLSGNYQVKDRVEINSLAEKLNIRRSQNISSNDLYEFNQQLDIKYLIVGQIYSFSKSAIGQKSKSDKIKLSIRIIDTETTKVVGIAIMYSNETERTQEEIEKMIKSIVLKLEG